MEIQEKEKIEITYRDADYNTTTRKNKKIKGIFIKDYGRYIQIYDKYNLRKSFMKQDIVSIEIVK